VGTETGGRRRRNDRATNDVVQSIRAAVEKVASTKGLEIVLDAAGGFLVYADRTLDLTPDVLTELNSKSKSGTQTPAATPGTTPVTTPGTREEPGMKTLTLAELAAELAGVVVGDGSTVIRGVAGIREAQPGDITFLANARYDGYVDQTRASAVICSREPRVAHVPLLQVDNRTSPPAGREAAAARFVRAAGRRARHRGGVARGARGRGRVRSAPTA